ncbi:MAG: hypothetical protein E7409_00560 [Ruminococcaceae bacterium]|nr:hypothetical protein [Oscillospiraceae bacterium]
MNAVGIDIGTTSICGIVLDTGTGEIIKSVTENSNAFIDTENDWEKIQSVEKIISLAEKILEKLVNENTKVIGVTGQMHGIVYFDECGNAVSPLYTWQDGRGNLPFDQSQTYSEYLGIPSGYGAVTDFYNTKNGIKPIEAVGYCTIHDYFAMTLTGRKMPLIHTSDAASFGGFDLNSSQFNHPFSSEVTAGFDLAGEYKGIPVSVAIGDNQASVFGAMSSDEDILLNIGTGSQISAISPTIVTGDNIETRPYFDRKYLVVGAALCGGRAYSMLEKFYSDIVFAATGERRTMYDVMASMPITDSDMRADTRFDGTRANPAITGSITGITTRNFTPGNMRRAVLEGIIAELHDMLEQMKMPCTRLIGSGNGIRKNKTLQQIAEQVFGATMKIPVHMEEAAFGAALYGMVASQKFGTAQDVKALIQYK